MSGPQSFVSGPQRSPRGMAIARSGMHTQMRRLELDSRGTGVRCNKDVKKHRLHAARANPSARARRRAAGSAECNARARTPCARSFARSAPAATAKAAAIHHSRTGACHTRCADAAPVGGEGARGIQHTPTRFYFLLLSVLAEPALEALAAFLSATPLPLTASAPLFFAAGLASAFLAVWEGCAHHCLLNVPSSPPHARETPPSFFPRSM